MWHIIGTQSPRSAQITNDNTESIVFTCEGDKRGLEEGERVLTAGGVATWRPNDGIG